MLRTIIVASLLTAAPALAQDTAAPAPAATPTPAPTPTQIPTPAPDQGVTAPPADSDIRVEGTPEQQRLADESVPTVVAPEKDVRFAIDAEWDNFDKDANGMLSEEEFGWFMKKIRETAGNTGDTSAEVGRLNAATFTEADSDQSKTVSREEMVALLMGPSA